MEPTDREIVDYLLGDIAEADQVRIEEGLFSDDDRLFERLSAIETRLIDLYVLEKLSPEQRKLFEEKYLVSPRRHSDVASATQFIRWVDTYREHQAVKPKRWAWLPLFFSTHNAAIQFAGASLLVMISIGFFWLLTERARLKNRSEVAEAALRQKEAQLQAQASNEQRVRADRDALGEQLDQTKELLRLREEESQGKPAADTRVSFATVVLSLMMRDGASPPDLVIGPRDKFVRLIVDWEGELASRYSISVKRVSDEKEVWNGPASRSKRRLTAVVPVGAFTDKNYYVRVDGASPGKPVIHKEFSLSVKYPEARN